MFTTLNAVFIIYVKADAADRDLLCEQFRPITGVFDQYVGGDINNVVASRRLIEQFQIIDGPWTRHEPISTCMVTSYLKNKLSSPAYDGVKAFDWVHKDTWACNTCNDPVVESPHLTTSNSMVFFPSTTNESVKQSMERVYRAGKKKKCDKCGGEKQNSCNTVTPPMILHLEYVGTDRHGPVYLPPHMERNVDLQGVQYELRGATYCDGKHFLFRYYVNDKVFECDDISIGRDAVSVEIEQPFEVALAGVLTEEKRHGMMIHEVFYYKMQ